MTTHKSRMAQGFTVVELMISLCVGGIAISSLYAVGAASTRHFREQQRISTTQSSLRSAMNQIKRDFARAGYLGTPNVAVNGESCGPVPSAPINDTGSAAGRGRLAAISAYQKTVALPSQLDPGGLNPTLAVVDDVILMGNYATSGEYAGIVLSADTKSVTVPTTTQSFSRDFTNWYAAGGGVAGACSNAALTNAFPRGRLARIRGLSNTNAFAQIDAAQCSTASATAQVDLQSTVPNCNATGGWISPVNTIRYHVENATLTEVSRVGGNRVAQLRRTEVDPTSKFTPLDVTEAGVTRRLDDRAVLDYVVRFTVDFIARTADPNTVSLVPAAQAVVQANPEYVRAAIIEIAARTSEHEPDMDVSLNTARLPPFRVLQTQGAARTRSLRAELFLPNVAYSRY